MCVRLEIHPEYSKLYGKDESLVPLPAAGESLRLYVARSGMGREEDILVVVNDRAVPWNYTIKEDDRVEIYPMNASG